MNFIAMFCFVFFFRNIDPNNLYGSEVQVKTFDTLLGTGQGKKYIDYNDYRFFSRGHLVAKADFLYLTLQRVTFHYANALPQWQKFNSLNWDKLEQQVRKFAGDYNHDLEVYTGGFEHSSLPNGHNVKTDLFLSPDRKMPVPRIFWKIVYHRTNRAGIAFIGLNNPYQEASEAEHLLNIVCEDISERVKWLHIKVKERKDVKRGYLYTCDMNKLHTTLLDNPILPVTSILGLK
jgi:DNA/RNA non-specific endonuclease